MGMRVTMIDRTCASVGISLARRAGRAVAVLLASGLMAGGLARYFARKKT